MDKTYARINWENEPSVATPLGATNLNKIDYAVNEIDNRVITLDTSKASQVDELLDIKTVAYNGTTGVWTFTHQNGTVDTFDQNIEKIPVTFSMDANGVITMTTADGTQYTCDVGTLIKTYTFSNSGNIQFTVTTDAQGNKNVTANVIDGSITREKINPDYLAQIDLDVASAASSAGAASSAANTSSANALKSEGFAVGQQNGTNVDSTSPYYENNAKYYKEQAAGSATNAATSESNASTSETNAYTYMNNASGSATNAATSESNAHTSELNAYGSATNAALSESNASASESNAATSASNALGSATTASNKALDAEAYAVGTRGGVPVTSGDPAYENNSKYYAEHGTASLAGLTDVNISSVTNGQVIKYNSTTQKWENGETSSSGHTIENESGTSMTARANLQLKGGKVTDDSTNDRTIFDVGYTQISYADWLLLTPQEQESGKWDIVGAPWQSGSVALVDLTDTAISSVANKDLLQFNSTTSKWENKALYKKLTATLTAGSTTLTFTDASIVATSLVKLFSAEELDYESATSLVGSVTFTFEVQASDVTFTLLVMNL